MRNATKNFVVSFSGGKDSTAMLLKMIESGEKIHSVIFFDTEWEFPEMYDHISKVEKMINMKIYRLRHKIGFDYLLHDRPIRIKSGPEQGKLRCHGYGWATMARRWCTREKLNVVEYYLKPIQNVVSCVGIAKDETQRNDNFGDLFIKRRFPLQEFDMTEKDALKYCYSKGLDWNGLYDYFDRVSCFCCPLQPKKNFEILKKFYPELWKRILSMQNKFDDYHTKIFV